MSAKNKELKEEKVVPKEEKTYRLRLLLITLVFSSYSYSLTPYSPTGNSKEEEQRLFVLSGETTYKYSVFILSSKA